MGSFPERSVDDSKSSLFTGSLSVLDMWRKPCRQLSAPMERSGSVRKMCNSSFESLRGKVRKLRSFFQPAKLSNLNPKSNSISDESQLQSPLSSSSSPISKSLPSKLKSTESFGSDPRVYGPWAFRLPGTEDRVVIYFTSLRGIRRTYEDCCAVRTIFRGFSVKVDERDISMDSAYKIELQSALGEKTVTLPQVFIRGKYVGGEDVIKCLVETGDLAIILKGLPIRAPDFVCIGCGNVRFLPCFFCNGSRKIFDEGQDRLRRCLECNENGLIRCPHCCS